MKRTLIEVDTEGQPPTKRRKLTSAETDLNEMVFQLAKDKKFREAKNIIAYENEEDRPPLVRELLRGLAKIHWLDTSFYYIHTFPDEEWFSLGEYFIAQLVINQSFEQAITWVKMYPEEIRYELAYSYLDELAKRGLLDQGLDFIQNLPRKEHLDPEEESKELVQLRDYFITQLIVYNHISTTLDYVEDTLASHCDRHSMRKACVKGLAKIGDVDRAEALIEAALWRWIQLSLRKKFIAELIKAEHIDLAKNYVRSLGLVSSLLEALVKNLAWYGYWDEAINQIVKAPNIEHFKLLKIFLENIDHDSTDEKANIKLMVFINNKRLNYLFADAICSWQEGLFGNVLLGKANKIIAIKKKYKIDSFTEANAIAELGAGTRTWILNRHSLFYQKSLPREMVDQVTEDALEVSAKHTQGVMTAVRNYHKRLSR